MVNKAGVPLVIRSAGANASDHTQILPVLKGLRRLRVRYDRLGLIINAWTTLAASVICFHILHHDNI
jgi:hypothetical protein